MAPTLPGGPRFADALESASGEHLVAEARVGAAWSLSERALRES